MRKLLLPLFIFCGLLSFEIAKADSNFSGCDYDNTTITADDMIGWWQCSAGAVDTTRTLYSIEVNIKENTGIGDLWLGVWAGDNLLYCDPFDIGLVGTGIQTILLPQAVEFTPTSGRPIVYLGNVDNCSSFSFPSLQLRAYYTGGSTPNYNHHIFNWSAPAQSGCILIIDKFFCQQSGCYWCSVNDDYSCNYEPFGDTCSNPNEGSIIFTSVDD